MSTSGIRAGADAAPSQQATREVRWPRTRLRFATSINPSRSAASTLPPDTEVSFVPMDAVGDDGSIRLDQTCRVSDVRQGYTFFAEGDVIIAKITPCFENGKGALARGLRNGMAFGTTELIVVRPRPGCSWGPYFQWLFTSPDFRLQAAAAMYGAGGQKRVPDDSVRDFVVALPSMVEQQAIAAFLDRETAKIDALVAEQERLLTLLAEKRQAVISRAVTQGLDPSVPMKDSGVEWIGKVPDTWKVIRLKYLVMQDGEGLQIGPFGGMLKTLEHEPTGLRLYGQQNIISGDFSVGDRWLSREVYLSEPAYWVRSGDLLVTRKGSLGNCRIVPKNIIPGWFDSDSICVRPDISQMSSVFLQLVMHEANYVTKQIDMNRRGAILSGLNTETLSNMVIAVPPVEMQVTVLSWIEREVGKLNRLTSESTQVVSLLRERRAALISAAVTGKVDVRALVPTAEPAREAA